MNELKGKILEQAQIEEFEDRLIAKFNESGKTDYYGFLQEIFINFVNDKKVLDSFMKDRMRYRNMEQMFVLLAFGGLVVACFQSTIFVTKEVDDSINDLMEHYIEENDTLIPVDKMFSTAKQPALFAFLYQLIRESGKIETGLFTRGEQLGDLAKRLEIISDLHFVINFLDTFYFE